ncbi:MAG TPA: twin-arginine translocase TatA/TatE family subunit [Pyrinomonadaceae bacterium]
MLAILEGLGTTELLVIVVVALILFGPRKLPQLSRSLGKSLGEFKRASEEFKTQWEKEVTLEERQKEARIEQATLPEDNSILGDAGERRRAVSAAADESATMDAGAAAASINGTDDSSTQQSDPIANEGANTPASLRKHDWL